VAPEKKAKREKREINSERGGGEEAKKSRPSQRLKKKKTNHTEYRREDREAAEKQKRPAAHVEGKSGHQPPNHFHPKLKQKPAKKKNGVTTAVRDEKKKNLDSKESLYERKEGTNRKEKKEPAT